LKDWFWVWFDAGIIVVEEPSGDDLREEVVTLTGDEAVGMVDTVEEDPNRMMRLDG